MSTYVVCVCDFKVFFFHSTKEESCWFCRMKNTNLDNILLIFFNANTEIIDFWFLWVPMTTSFIIWGKKGPLFLFLDCLSVTGFLSWEIYLNSYFDNYILILFSAHHLHIWILFMFCGQMDSLAFSTPSYPNTNTNKIFQI